MIASLIPSKGSSPLPPSPELIGLYIANCVSPDDGTPALSEDILDMIARLSFGLRDQRDRTILLVGYAGGLRGSEIVSLDVNREDKDEGWTVIEERGLILTFRGKTGWREVEIGCGYSDQTCPVHALEQYLH